MADRHLNLHQQIALLPAAIPDSVLDFLEDFQHPASLQSEAVRAAFDPDYLKAQSAAVQGELDQLRQQMGKLLQLQVDQGGREVPGGFLLKLTFEQGVKGVALLTKLKERTIFRVLVQAGDYNEADLKVLAKNPPKLG